MSLSFKIIRSNNREPIENVTINNIFGGAIGAIEELNEFVRQISNTTGLRSFFVIKEDGDE